MLNPTCLKYLYHPQGVLKPVLYTSDNHTSNKLHHKINSTCAATLTQRFHKIL